MRVSAGATRRDDHPEPADWRSGVRSQTTVLVVDDDECFRRSIARFLAAAGFRITTASDGEEALRQCATGLPSAIVLDGEMPHMDGPTFCRCLTRVLGGRIPPIVVVSGDVFKAADAAWPGVVAAFHKPPPVDRLVRALRDAIDFDRELEQDASAVR